MYSNLIKKEEVCLQNFSTTTTKDSKHMQECQVRKLTIIYILNLGLILKTFMMEIYFF